ncbi:MAG: 3D domain-containing protein [Armatimonadetes bacterium]|nr:3D domain-containing protein [Armatimonadota bacterium]
MRRLSTTVTSLGLLLFVSPVLAGPVTSLGNAHVASRTEVKKLPKDVQYVFDRAVGTGRLKKMDDGEDGEIRTVVQEVQFGGKTVAKGNVSVKRTEPRPTLMAMGRTGYGTSRGAFNRSKVMTVVATAYTPYDGSATGHTATGRKAKYGVIAVDPRVIPLGSLVFVEGYGFAIAADTGGAIKGNRIDVCFTSASQVNNWGRKKVVIHVFKERAAKNE